MNLKTVKWRVQYALQYFPFTLNTLLFAAAAWVGYKLLYKPTPKGQEPSSIMPFIILMGKMTYWILAGFVLLSIISAFFCWIYYLVIRGQKNSVLKLEFKTESRKGKRNKLFLNATLPGALRPVLGFVKGRIIYDNHLMTDRFALLSGQRKERSIWREAITGKSQVTLPDIKEYDVKGGFVYFQDMLHLFSLAVAQPIAGHFYQPPVLLNEDDAEVSPRKTETLDVRIEQLRRVEGELLNYKDFEAGDDVRRIIWKVYARNRELVVRIPEMYEPFASHLQYYASFYADVKQAWMGDEYLEEMLNYFKNHVWTVYDTLSKKEWKMAFVPDQDIHVDEGDEHERTARIISNSQWHTDKNVSEYFSPKNGTVLCISSFTNPNDLANLLERCDAGTVVYYVKLSHTFKHFAALSLLSRLILLPPQDRLSKLRTRWLFSPMRLQVNKKEKEIEKVLKNSNVTWGEL